jgi:hypothetical protein
MRVRVLLLYFTSLTCLIMLNLNCSKPPISDKIIQLNRSERDVIIPLYVGNSWTIQSKEYDSDGVFLDSWDIKFAVTESSKINGWGQIRCTMTICLI